MLQRNCRLLIRTCVALLGLMMLASPVWAATPRFRSPAFVRSSTVMRSPTFVRSTFFNSQLRPFINSPNFRLMFQPLGGGAQVFTLSNGAMQARLVTQPLGGGANVITFNNGATQARLVFQPLGGGAQVLTFNSTGNITARQLL